MLTGLENAMAGCCEIPVGRAQLRGGSRGGGAGRLHPLHRALERADRPLVPRHAGSITIHWNIKGSYVCLIEIQVLSNVLAVVPWVIDFIVDSGWAQEIVR